MAHYILLFHSTLGVVQTRRTLQAAGEPFTVADIPRALRGGCGLCIHLECERPERWVLPGLTESIYRVDVDGYQPVARYPAG
ncbi:DUF3343 domain-containing protein [Yokenella regensburgei]|uniref:Protein of uncharacterized function (DUF3343) n=1 Tax=Yokenella regensburgei TaxID=158877 RepID=A0AB38FVC6_9ENTR|nr:DUF3343 domain-containing protein [Yokenella regensburgei]EHM51640.1 hypothetical protein HMPREF0880_00447 [Yokenella regensburgei ATCC 43003]KAF1370776.1 hypothetical protein FHR25_000871 [Yokenella regensburgei]KFD25228.1 hypothetical protein GYRE_00279 [Yokenella regensburgei ATCC 49455]MDQ4429444.1 DUF3343 domain-containing protein [Yokenella regensburgei]MDR2216910.1 DUF3343 domain-containing protein [Yokenella regensburgei]